MAGGFRSILPFVLGLLGAKYAPGSSFTVAVDLPASNDAARNLEAALEYDMATECGNFCLYQGDDIELHVTVTEVENGTDRQDLTGMTLEWAFSASKGGEILESKTIGAGITVTDAAEGEFTVAIAAADTEELEAQGYYHEARLTDGDGHSRVILRGVMTVKPSITA